MVVADFSGWWVQYSDDTASDVKTVGIACKNWESMVWCRLGVESRAISEKIHHDLGRCGSMSAQGLEIWNTVVVIDSI